jgi:pimeloyl-ACP methyl ester carboxylesterase
MRTMGKLILLLFYLGLAALVGLPAIWFLFRAESWVGVGLALLGIIMVLWLGSGLLGWLQPARRALWGWTSLALALAGLALLGLILWYTPDGRPSPTSPVQHRFTQPVAFQRYTIANIVPEIEQINLGFAVMPFVDPLFTFSRAQRVAPFTLALYREMEEDPNFHQLGSAQGWAYTELLQQPFEVGHYYLYLPQQRPEGSLPVLIFLHGSAGNFKTYTWVWSKLAEQQGLVVIAPSYGFGNWRYPDTIEVVSRALADAATQVEIDPERIYLAGLSNGGLGVSYLAAAQPDQFRGLIFLSPVMETRLVDDPAFLERWRGRPVLVMTGAADERIPLRYVEQQIRVLREGGVAVTEHIYPGEDHFLVFSQPEAIREDVLQWLRLIEK